VFAETAAIKMTMKMISFIAVIIIVVIVMTTVVMDIVNFRMSVVVDGETAGAMIVVVDLCAVTYVGGINIGVKDVDRTDIYSWSR